jgi:phosphatidylglycerophosphatase A
VRALGVRASHPAVLLASWFGSGFLPWAPGTWASLIACVLAWIIVGAGGATALLVAALVALVAGTWAADIVGRRSGVADAGAIVIDEVAGQWLTLAVAPRTFLAYAAGFLLFRLFDVIKPWPVSWADRALPGGIGVMADDVLAAAYAASVLALGRWFLAH